MLHRPVEERVPKRAPGGQSDALDERVGVGVGIQARALPAPRRREPRQIHAQDARAVDQSG
jgi:hypothetical protein